MPSASRAALSWVTSGPDTPARNVRYTGSSPASRITGRPVILLAGELPVYRTLRAGVSGPDVTQLKAALLALGIDPGNAGSNTYDTATAAAVRELYARVGYPAPTAGEEADAALDGAREMVRGAEEQVAAAQRALTAGGATSYTARVAAQAAVDTAQAVLTDAEAKDAACKTPLPAPPELCETAPVTNANGQLQTAIADRDAANAPPDTSELRAAVASAIAVWSWPFALVTGAVSHSSGGVGGDVLHAASLALASVGTACAVSTAACAATRAVYDVAPPAVSARWALT